MNAHNFRVGRRYRFRPAGEVWTLLATDGRESLGRVAAPLVFVDPTGKHWSFDVTTARGNFEPLVARPKH